MTGAGRGRRVSAVARDAWDVSNSAAGLSEAYSASMLVRRSRLHSGIALYLAAAAALPACSALSDITGICSDSELPALDRAAAYTWETLGSPTPPEDAYCDSGPYPYVGGQIPGQDPEELLARAREELGCREFEPPEGFDSDGYSQLLECTFDDEPYMLEVTTDLSVSRSVGVEVGLYKT